MAHIKDARTLAAMAHPLRRRLMDLLRVDGPATPSALARGTDEAVANISHHLRVLAEAGLVAEAPELARNRKERWWRVVNRSLVWQPADFLGDAAAIAVVDEVLAIGLRRQVELVTASLADPRARQGRWRDSAFSSDNWLRLTPAELIGLRQELQAVIDRYRGLAQEPAAGAEDEPAAAERQPPAGGGEPGEDRESVFVFVHGFPARP